MYANLFRPHIYSTLKWNDISRNIKYETFAIKMKEYEMRLLGTNVEDYPVEPG